MINIEDDEVTCNSYVVFSQIKKENFIYVDRHGNWVVGGFYLNPTLSGGGGHNDPP